MAENPLTHAREVLLLGIGGSGMRGLAHLLQGQGAHVNGVDSNYAAIRDDADLSEFTVAPEDATAELLAKADVVIFSDAVLADHAGRTGAVERGVPALPYNEAVGWYSHGSRTLAVAGSHGKSSTTALLFHVLRAGGLDPSVLLGAGLPELGGRHSHVGGDSLFIVEADEYMDHFLALRPQHAIVTSIDFDHPDYFASLEQTQRSFERFMGLLPSDGTVVVPEAVHSEHALIAWPANTVTVAEAAAEGIELPLPGAHMRRNASLAVALAEQLGVDREVALRSLSTFKGLSRRFERLGVWQSLQVISDYGHHPAEIAATLQGAREVFPQQRILVVVEVHTAERLVRLAADYVRALSGADGVVAVPVFVPRGRESERGAAAEELARMVAQLGAVPHWQVQEWADLPAVLAERAGDFDVLLGFSAGVLDSKLRELSHSVDT